MSRKYALARLLLWKIRQLRLALESRENLWMVLNLKTLRISDGVHRRLTRLLGEIIAQRKEIITYSDVLKALISKSVLLPPEMLRYIEAFLEGNEYLGYKRHDEFLLEAVIENLCRLQTNARESKARSRKKRGGLREISPQYEKKAKYL